MKSEENKPLITWIIPVYNGEKYIRQTILSILRQPCKDCLVMVVDDGSTDSTASIVEGISSERIRYLRKGNGGVSAARNYGIMHSQSPYVAFLDADDVLCKVAYDEELRDIVREEKYDMFSFPYICADGNLTRGNVSYGEMREGEIAGKDLSFYKHASSFLYNRNIFEGENPVLFPEGIKYHEDIVFFFQLTHRHLTARHVNRYWFMYRNNPHSALHTIRDSVVYRECVKAWSYCREKCTDREMLDECDAWLFSYVAWYIQSASREGVFAEEIQGELDRFSLQETLDNYSALWKRSKLVYEAFGADPEGYCKLEWRVGRKERMKYRLKRNPLIRFVYHRVKYRQDIRQYLP